MCFMEIFMSETKRSFINREFTISYESYEQGWTMPYTHYHNDYEIYILESGVRIVTLTDIEYTTASYDAILFDRNLPHTSRGTLPFSGICIHFSDLYLTNHLTPFSQTLLLKCFKTPLIHLSPEAFLIIKQYADNFTIFKEDNFVILIHILYLLNIHSENPLPLTEKKLSLNTKRTMTKAEQIFDYVEAKYTHIKSIDELANAFEVTESYIFKLYKKHYHQTPKQYINKLRINHACHRLKNTDETVRSIAAECGYDSYEYFMRVFKNSKNCTPLAYRRNQKG